MMFDDEEVLIEEKILNNCKPYLKLLKHMAKNGVKRPLLRGSAQPYDNLTRIQVQERKQPMSMSTVDHQMSNKWFSDTFGIAARTETVFTTTNRGLAKRYGTIHFIFPIGKFSIINSPEYSDLFFRMSGANKLDIYKKLFGVVDGRELETYDDIKDFMEELAQDEPLKYQELINVILEEGKYEKNNYSEAFKNGNEIMLKCKAFYIVTADEERINDFINDFVWDEIYF